MAMELRLLLVYGGVMLATTAPIQIHTEALGNSQESSKSFWIRLYDVYIHV